MIRTERAVHADPAARGLTVMVEVHSQSRCNLLLGRLQLVRPCMGQENA